MPLNENNRFPIVILFVSTVVLFQVLLCGCHTSAIVFPVSVGDRMGYINRKGEIVIEATFCSAEPFCENLALVKDDRYYYIDLNGNEAISLLSISNLVYATSFSEGFAVVSFSSGNVSFINKKGQIAFQGEFQKADPFSEGYAAVKVDNRWGYIDTYGRSVIPAKFDNALPFSEGVAHVSLGGKWGVIDSKGCFLVDPVFSYTGYIHSHGFSLVYNDMIGKDCAAHFINQEGKNIFEKTFQAGLDFSEGLAPICINRKVG